ncbi:beta-galactosidase [Kineococcus xinjiangensis]|uniref:Beta-galactosidase n=1 Tax=Kineococcus xinjiangensis TaxID=512762 RepID=A0A2S6IEJ6_9ACTN|nr:beta-galactosidase family protein [Kineococcus xinjiangensis]PPK92644.1 beta-galactosidase [Kineococcus xinjiangensis]
MTTFEIGEEDFLLDGEPHRVLSGALHYFRIHPGQWADRIHKARLMGLNTIETYVAWNAHAPRRGEFDLSGGLDLGRFLDLVAAEGMHAIVRPGPYICAEWHNGGLPAWLFDDEHTGVRRSEPRFLSAVADYLAALAPVLVPRQVDRGGPVVLVQVENEYGAYGSDAGYLRTLTRMTRDIGITVPLTSVDQPTDEMLRNGSVPGLHKTASFGSRSLERLKTLREHQPSGPLMCSEFWDGWFDHWGEHHHTTSAAQAAADLDDLLSLGASVNVYMVHGGTNFGATNGANHKGTYQPIVTSYDYDAALDEAGQPTQKYWAFREVLARHTSVPDYDVPPAAPAPAFSVRIESARPLAAVLEQLGEESAHAELPTMDAVGEAAGYPVLAVYRAELPGEPRPGVLEFGEVRDRAQVRVDGRPVGVVSRDAHERALPLPAGRTVELLVEDLGRVNYGPHIGEAKGLVGPVHFAGDEVRDWNVRPLDLTRVPRLSRGADVTTTDIPVVGPVVLHASFDLPPGAVPGRYGWTGDLFLSTRGWGKGLAWVNGFCLGRYWSRGPQRTLYVPAPLLRAEGNELVLLEQHVGRDTVEFVPGLDLGHTEA